MMVNEKIKVKPVVVNAYNKTQYGASLIGAARIGNTYPRDRSSGMVEGNLKSPKSSAPKRSKNADGPGY